MRPQKHVEQSLEKIFTCVKLQNSGTDLAVWKLAFFTI